MSEYVIANKSDLVSVAEAIREKSGITDTLTFPTGFVSAIGEIQSNSGDDEAAVEYVNFRDYDGTVLYSYTVEEAAALTQLPPLPTHEGLVCQGWNWTLTDIKEMGRAVEVGTMYITDDGKTRIYIHLEEEWKSPMLGICLNGTATVDWGDGTMTDTLVGTSVEEKIWTSNHEYVTAGDYVIKLTVDGTVAFSANKFGSIMCHSNTASNQDLIYSNSVRKIELGNNITTIGNAAFRSCNNLSSITLPDSITAIGDDTFYYCYKLSSVTLPNSVTTIGSNAFRACANLLSITLPNSITTIGSYAFSNCSLSSITLPNNLSTIGSYAFYNNSGLSSITLPNSVTTIGDYAFNYCYNLSSITLPNSITTIGDHAFSNCCNVRYYDFSTFTTIPKLGGTNVFSSIFYNADANTKIRVPLSLYKTWIKSEHWSDYSDYITYVGTPYWVNISSNDGGAVTPTGQVLAAPADNISLKIVPDDTHTLSDITLDGASVKDDTVYYDFSGQSYSVSAVDGATYGFALNSDGYYESNNQGVNSSAALCKIVFNLSAEKQVTIDAITYGEDKYDYGLFGAVDQVLDTTSTVDSGIFWNGKGKSSADPYQVTYTIPAGEHFVYAKYIKDSSSNQNKDSLQFKVNLETKSYYTYDINNVQSDHTVVVTFGKAPS